MNRLKVAAVVQTICLVATKAVLGRSAAGDPVSRQVIRIGTLGNHQTVRFAAGELADYLRRMSQGTVALFFSAPVSMVRTLRRFGSAASTGCRPCPNPS